MKLFRNILYVAESTAAQGPTMARAVSLAENNQADLTVIDVVPAVAAGARPPRGGPSAAELQSAVASARRKELDALVAPYRAQRDIRIETPVGRTFLEVIRAVLRNGHDLVIKPAENPDFLERLFGGDDMHLLRKCPCPLWLTGPAEEPDYRCILAAVDFNVDDAPDPAEQGLNRQILELAASLALSDFAKLHLVHVWHAPAEMMVRSWSDHPDEAGRAYVDGERSLHDRALDRLRQELRDRMGEEAYAHLSPQFHLLRGTASTLIPEMARRLKADLVVMGTVARTGIAGLLIGNTAEAILEQLQCSVLAVKPPGFVCPVALPG